jgi:hypothetical protein
MHRKALIAITVGSILGSAAHAAGEQPAAVSSPDSQAPPVSVTGENGQPITPETSAHTQANKQIAQDQRAGATTSPGGASSETKTTASSTPTQSTYRANMAADDRGIAHDQAAIGEDRKDIRYDQAQIRQSQADMRNDYSAEKATGVNDQAQIAQDKTRQFSQEPISP